MTADTAQAGPPRESVVRRRDIHRRRRLSLRLILPVLLVLGWLAVTGAGGQTFGQLSEVSSDDQATFLPAEAESTRALDLAAEFGEDAVPATVIAATGELSDEDLREAAGVAEEAESLDGVVQVVGPQPSEDGEAVQILVLLTEEAAEDGGVAALQELAAEGFGEQGWTAHVTGPAALSQEFSEAFAGIDGLLLGVAIVAVFVILVAVYRSVVLPVLVLISSVAALCAAVVVVYQLAAAEWIMLNGQTQGILSILVIGAATDYSLLLIARYREELSLRADRFAALWAAWRRSVPPILASGGTVAVALLCLLFSELNSNIALGPATSLGIVFAMAATLTFLPAMLALTGRPVFWPKLPRPQEASAPLWRRVAGAVRSRPRLIWFTVTLLLAAAALGVTQLRAEGVPQSDLVLGETENSQGQELLEEHFDAGTGSPSQIFVPEAEREEALEIVEDVEGVSEAYLTADGGQPAMDPAEADVVDDWAQISATLSDPGDSLAAEQTVRELREALAAIDAETLVGGTSATQLDTNETAQRDLVTIVPIVLLVVLGFLVVLLRALVAPLLLIGTTVLSYLSALGISALVFNHIFGFPGADATVPLFGFMFLVALGVDYTIFLMSRAREEAPHRGTQEGLLRSLVVTGGVITSAGIVLAATFSALAVLPLMFMVQLAFLVALGVFIDTFVVRTLQVPALGVDIGRRIWWPARIGRRSEGGAADPPVDVTRHEPGERLTACRERVHE